MDFICHKDYNGMSEAGFQVSIKRGEILPLIGVRIAKNNASICVKTSEVGHMYFARNDDNKGLERGDLTYAIAYSPREKEHSDGHVFRFSEEEIKMLRKDWSHFLRDDDAVILFNDDFFNGEIDELRKLADLLELDV